MGVDKLGYIYFASNCVCMCVCVCACVCVVIVVCMCNGLQVGWYLACALEIIKF